MICIFSSVILVAFMQLSFGAMNYSSINRCFQNMYKGLFEACVETIGPDGEEHSPYFNKALLKMYITEYFDTTISKYSSDYKASLYFTNGNTNDVCTSEECTGVKVNLDAPINSIFHFEKTRSFYINQRGEVR